MNRRMGIQRARGSAGQPGFRNGVLNSVLDPNQSVS